MFVYKYFSDHLLNLAQRGLPTILTKRILKDTLRGIVVLHDRDIVHTGKYTSVAGFKIIWNHH